MELISCPRCGQPATVQWRALLESTDGPFEHARIDCAAGHWFFMPADRLVHYPQLATPGRRVATTR